jgi:sugar phosphate isomerase/epimerase
MQKFDRRDFLRSAAFVTTAGLLSSPDLPAFQAGTQKFTVGYAPLAGATPTMETFWKAADEVAALGFRALETDNSRLHLAEAYAQKAAEFKQEIAKRKLTLYGLAQYAALSTASQRQEVIDTNVLLGKFLQAVGGKYIVCLFVSQPSSGNQERQTNVVNPDRVKQLEAAGQEELRTAAETANEVGKRLKDLGIHYGFHGEGAAIRSGFFNRLMDATNPEYFGFIPDTGHLVRYDNDPLEVIKKYHSRITTIHFKDWDPNSEWELRGKPQKGRFVPLGQGIVKFQPIVDYLKQSGFGGFVMGELDYMEEKKPDMRNYMVNTLKLRL